MLVGDGAHGAAGATFWRDTNGDGKADTKLVVANDYGAKPNPKLPLSSTGVVRERRALGLTIDLQRRV